jgi:ribosome-associated protein
MKEDDVLSDIQHAADPRAAAGAGMTAQAHSAGAPGDKSTLLETIVASLEDDKAEDIVTIDLSGRSSMADQMVVCSGRSSRQVSAIAEKLIDRVKTGFGFTPRAEGRETGDWVLIDAGDVVVHVFRPEVREFYQLEKMWQPSGVFRAGAESAGGSGPVSQ